MSVAIIGCAPVVQQTNPNVASFERYINVNKPLAEQGTLKWSDYYAELYARAVAVPTPRYHYVRIANLKDVALMYEAGKISRDEFMQARRETTADIQADAAAEQANKQQANIEQYARVSAAMQAMQASAPKPYMLPMPTQTGPRQAAYEQPQQAQALMQTPIVVTATANWTGRQNQAQTVTHQQAINCEYQYAGATFWRLTMAPSCASSVQVQ